MEEELEDAINWLSALEIDSEYAASNKEFLLSTIEQQQEKLDQIKLQLRYIKFDLDIEPWSIYKVDGSVLFEIINILERK